MTGECAAEQGVPCGCMQWCYYLLPQQLSWVIVGGGHSAAGLPHWHPAPANKI